MYTIGLLGGVASGKSLVAQQLAELGAVVLDADRAGHVVLEQAEVIQAARDRWGEQVVGPDGRLLRPVIAGLVFGDSPSAREERRFLEQLTHPRIGELLQQQSLAAVAQGASALVLDAPLLLQAGWDRGCDTIVFVDAPRATRLARALGRGWTEEEFDAREGAQESLDQKRERADVIIDNSQTPAATRAQVERFWQTHLGQRSPNAFSRFDRAPPAAR